MSTDPYSAKVRELFASPAHGGDLADAVVAETAQQGIRLRLSAIHANGRIEALRFRAYGCPHVIAACELFCQAFEGRPVTALNDFQVADIMGDLSVPVEKTGRILVLEDAVRLLGDGISAGAAS
jgi:NifU-like protein involved in Fe-S cluster formation